MGEADSEQPKARPRRRWLTFSIRTMLVAMLIVAGIFAWLGKYVMRARTERAIVAQIRLDGGNVFYDYMLTKPLRNGPPTPKGSKMVRAIFGDDIYATVHFVHFGTSGFRDSPCDAACKDLHKLEDLNSVNIWSSGFTDKCIDDLLRIKNLKHLSLSQVSITTEGYSRLSESKTLFSLTLYGESGTCDAPVTDAHLQALPEFPHLRHLYIRGNYTVTEEAIANLKSKMPNCQIFRSQ